MKKKLNKFSCNRKIKPHRTMRFWFVSAVVLLISLASFLSAMGFIIFAPIIGLRAGNIHFIIRTLFMALLSIILGSILSIATCNFFIKKIKRLSNGMKEISKGNFNIRIEETDKNEVKTEFGEIERTFNQMASDLEGIEMFRNDFINNFSHEFKTPIVSIRGFAKQLKNDNLSQETRTEYIDIIISESNRLANMSSNILLLTKLENQQIVSEKTTFSLDEQIRNSILLLDKEWSCKNIEFNLDKLDDVQYNFNEEMLSHVWINLISNAIKFTDENGLITISLENCGDNIIFKIRDNGLGMNEETKSRIFEKFYQGDKSHHSGGNGIGLNIASRIITLAGGKIEVESEIDCGSEFTVILPVFNEN